MKMPTVKNLPNPSVLFPNPHDLYDNLSTSVTRMTAPFDREEELWPQFEVSAQSVTDAFKKYVEIETRCSSWGSSKDGGSRRVSLLQPRNS